MNIVKSSEWISQVVDFLGDGVWGGCLGHSVCNLNLIATKKEKVNIELLFQNYNSSYSGAVHIILHAYKGGGQS